MNKLTLFVLFALMIAANIVSAAQYQYRVSVDGMA